MLLGIAYGAYETYLRFTHIYEYDARVTADIVTISSRADGWVVEMPVREGMRVTAGQVVAKIDDRTAKLKSDALRAQIETEHVKIADALSAALVEAHGVLSPTQRKVVADYVRSHRLMHP